MASVKKKRVSKKNKKSWRKNVNLEDVDNFLEDQRLEERLGFRHSELKDRDLFIIDKEGNVGNVREVVKVPEYNQVKRTSSNSLRLRETEIPKCFSALVNKSAVPPHIIKKTRIRKENSQSAVARKIRKRNLTKEVLKAKSIIESQVNKNKESKSIQGEFKYDVWSKENNDRDLNGCSEWLSSDAIRHTLHNTGKLRKEIPKAILSKTSLLPAVEPPHPGLSYNPSLKDHQDILNKVVETEVDMMKEEKHIERVTTNMFKKKPRSKVEQEWLSEMTVGLFMEKTQSDEDDDGDGEYMAVNPPVKNKKKTLQKRRKLKEAQLLKEKLRKQKIEKKKISDVYKLRKFKEALDKKEEKTKKNMAKRKEMKEKKPYTVKTLSQIKYKEPEVEFNLAEELSGNLRNVKAEGNLLFDRFKSLQKRNILQPTMKRHVRKRKMKKYERSSTKMGWEPKGYVPYVKPEKSK